MSNCCCLIGVENKMELPMRKAVYKKKRKTNLGSGVWVFTLLVLALVLSAVCFIIDLV